MCDHYSRNCSIVAPCCNNVYNCRFCHDDIHFNNETNYKVQHKIDRYQIEKMVCNKCNLVQQIKQYCENCNECMAQYYCDICHLFDNEDKQQFHCDKCNCCRIGGENNYVHCDICELCIKKDTEHKCLSIKDSCCSICMEDLFTSTIPIIQMECGHRIHNTCFAELIQTSYKCPLCSKSLANMDNYNAALTLEIENTPMPQEYNYNVKILCNDCHEESENKFHIFGIRCETCKGYNTKRI